MVPGPAPVPIIGISTVRSSRLSASGGMPLCSCPRTMIVRWRAAERSPRRTDSSASSTPTIDEPAWRCLPSHVTGSPVQWTQARCRRVLPRASASGTQGRRGTARHAPTASQVRRRVPRLTPCSGHSGAAIRWSQHECGRGRRSLRRSFGVRTRGCAVKTRRGRTLHIECSSGRRFAAHRGHRWGDSR